MGGAAQHRACGWWEPLRTNLDSGQQAAVYGADAALCDTQRQHWRDIRQNRGTLHTDYHPVRRKGRMHLAAGFNQLSRHLHSRQLSATMTTPTRSAPFTRSPPLPPPRQTAP